MPANVGGEPKPVKTGSNELQTGAPRHQPAKLTAIAGKRHRQRRRMLRHKTDLIHGSTPNGRRIYLKLEISELPVQMRSDSMDFYADLSNSSRPISIRRISLVPAPIS